MLAQALARVARVAELEAGEPVVELVGEPFVVGEGGEEAEQVAGEHLVGHPQLQAVGLGDLLNLSLGCFGEEDITLPLVLGRALTDGAQIHVREFHECTGTEIRG